MTAAAAEAAAAAAEAEAEGEEAAGGGLPLPGALEVAPVRLGEVAPGDDLAAMIASACPPLADGDAIVVSHKAVSKQEGRAVRLSSIAPSELAAGLASAYGKDPRVVELVLSEARRIVRMGGAGGGAIITETRGGLVCANSGVDESNAPDGHAVLLPEDPDGSARRLRGRIAALSGRDVAVVISDTFGRPFRIGQTDCAVGAAGTGVVRDHAGCADASGRTLRVTAIAVADELCAAAELVKGKASSVPVAVVRFRGARGPLGGGEDGRPAGEGAAALLRPASEDMFR